MPETHRHAHPLARRFGMLALVVVLLSATSPAWAVPATPPASSEATSVVSARLARLQEFKRQLDELDKELGIAAEAYNAAQLQLAETRELAQGTRIDLENAEIAYRVQSDELMARVVEIYRTGALEPLDVLFGSKSVSDFLARVRFLNAISEADASALAALAVRRDHVRTTARELQQVEQQAAELEFSLKARKIEVLLRIEERKEMMAAAAGDLIALLDTELAARAAEEAALMRDILSGANKAGIDLTPGGVVETALAYHGIPYVWAGADPTGFDCSGLVMYVFKQHGVILPHYSRSQFTMGVRVLPDQLLPGDTVFFGTPVYHVGIYVGGGYFVHAPRTGDVVRLARLADRLDYAGARRYAWQPRTAPILGVDANAADALE